MVCVNHGKKYTLLHELACNIATYCMSGRGIFTSRRRVKIQPTSEIITICMLTRVIECLLSIPEQRLVSSHTKYWVTRRSNASILPRSPRARAITPVQYRVILHGTGIGKYCCRRIINIYIPPSTVLSTQQVDLIITAIVSHPEGYNGKCGS